MNDFLILLRPKALLNLGGFEPFDPCQGVRRKFTSPLANSLPSWSRQLTGSPASNEPVTSRIPEARRLLPRLGQRLDGSVIECQRPLAARRVKAIQCLRLVNRRSLARKRLPPGLPPKTCAEKTGLPVRSRSSVATPYSLTFLAARTFVAMPPVPSERGGDAGASFDVFGNVRDQGDQRGAEDSSAGLP